MEERCVLFVDGNNWYHAMKNAGMAGMAFLDYSKISKKLVHGRCWKETRYYVGQISNEPHNRGRYNDQQRFLSRLKNSHPKITVHLGRIEKGRLATQFLKN